MKHIDLSSNKKVQERYGTKLSDIKIYQRHISGLMSQDVQSSHMFYTVEGPPRITPFCLSG